ncbi:hypothetical protein CA850_12235 [Micromonospora echinospora]|uniref:Uncharacterized protein n=1 Tax=Micromonospora echinospora TaxID=1877 RepID=A0A1C4UB34_MICEC|nr:DUF6461 domain-containing protein [Micromonospora echinospora]OZV80924.1 hypothetical protein CA850_12235 [Micromonospora echinospora]SCE68867.1 hypothetical protein GA0070618_0172 [Micromonospora echinospora]
MHALDHYTDLLARPDVPTVALCLTVVAVGDTDEALLRYDAFQPDRRATLVDLAEEVWMEPVRIVVADRHGDGVLLVEPNGFHGTRPPVLRRLSRGTTAASVYWNVNAVSRLSYACDGEVIAAFEILGGPPRDLPPVLVPFLDGLDFGPGLAWASALTFLERVAGARLTADWFHAPHPASLIVDPERFDRPATLAALLPGIRDHHWSSRSVGGPNLPEPARAVFRRRAEGRGRLLRRAADLTVRQVLPDVALSDPASLTETERQQCRADLMAAARESYRAGAGRYWADEDDDDDGPTGGGIEDLVAEISAEQAAEEAAQAALRRSHALAAARHRLLADPRAALAGALAQARSADPVGWPHLRQQVTDLLTRTDPDAVAEEA